MVGFFLARPQILDPASPAGTLASLAQHGDLARLGVAGTMIVIVAQAVAAVGCYALLRGRQPVAAFGIAGFGLLNAILMSALERPREFGVMMALGTSPARWPRWCRRRA